MSESFEVARKALDLMAEVPVSPSPANYEFWLRYSSGFDKELVSAVDQLRNRDGGLTARAVDSVRKDFLGTSYGETVTSLVDSVGQKLDTVTAAVILAGGDAQSYLSTLEAGSSSLTRSTSAQDQQRMIESIASATSQMIERTRALEEQLARSAQEISALRNDLEAARSESRTDGLTGLPNRRAFECYLEAHAARATADRRPLCLVFGDIDHFKSFNDTWGHRMGDEVLRLVGKSLDRIVQGIGYPARYGGEEFVIVLPNKDLRAAEDIAEQVRDFIASRQVRSKHSNQNIGRITISLGIAQLRWSDTLESLIERADAALYLAKEQGRNRVLTEAALPAPEKRLATA